MFCGGLSQAGQQGEEGGGGRRREGGGGSVALSTVQCSCCLQAGQAWAGGQLVTAESWP